MNATANAPTASKLRAEREHFRQRLATLEREEQDAISEHERALADHAAGRNGGSTLKEAREARNDATEALTRVRVELDRLNQELEQAEATEYSSRITSDLAVAMADCGTQGRELHGEIVKFAAKLVPRYLKLLERLDATKELHYENMKLNDWPKEAGWVHNAWRDARQLAEQAAFGAHAGLGLLLADLLGYTGQAESRPLPEQIRLARWEKAHAAAAFSNADQGLLKLVPRARLDLVDHRIGLLKRQRENERTDGDDESTDGQVDD